MDRTEYRAMHEVERRHWWFRAKRRLAYALLARWGVRKGRVLDVGCGTGSTLQELPPGYRGTGIDPAPEALAFCRSRGLGRLALASATAIPLADASADAVLTLDVIEHIDDDVGALREIARVLAPAGIAILTVPAHPFLWSAHDEALHHKRRYTRRVLEERLERAGLTVRAGSYAYGWALPAAAFLRLVRRVMPARRSSRRSDVRVLPRWLDELAYHLTGWELPLCLRSRLPLGLSLVYVVTPSSSPRRARQAPGPPDLPPLVAAAGADARPLGR